MMRYVFLLGLILLSGCETADAPVRETPLPVVEAETPPPEEAPEVVTPDPPRFVIETILNLAPHTLQTILGIPSLVRREQKAEVWLYRNSECVMHLYFYPNDNGDLRLEYVETAARNPAAVNPTVSSNACLDSHVLAEEAAPEITPELSFPDSGTGLPPDRPDS